MIIGFSRHGTGHGSSPVGYLTDATVSAGPLGYLTGDKAKKGIPRNPAPVVVRGDPKRIRILIDSVRFKNKYSSGVLSFAPGEKITPVMEEKIIDDFERAAFAGFDRDRFEVLWVRHRHTPNHRHELHFLTPRIELQTGKSLNIAPPRKGTRELFDTLRSKINAEYGLSDPDDPARRRLERIPSHIQKLQARNRQNDPAQRLPASDSEEKQLRPDPEKAAKLQRKLTPLIEARAAYNRQRYRSPQVEPVISVETIVPTFDSHDRVRTPPSGCLETPRIAIPGPRSAVRENTERFNTAAQRWSRTDGNLECADQRFSRANRAVASDFEKAVIIFHRKIETSALFRKYGISANGRPIPRERDHDLEPEMEIPFAPR